MDDEGLLGFIAKAGRMESTSNGNERQLCLFTLILSTNRDPSTYWSINAFHFHFIHTVSVCIMPSMPISVFVHLHIDVIPSRCRTTCPEAPFSMIIESIRRYNDDQTHSLVRGTMAALIYLTPCSVFNESAVQTGD